MGEPTVIASWTETVLQAAEGEGLPVADIRTEVGLDRGVLADPEARIPFRQHNSLWQEIDRHGGGRRFGIRVAEAYANGESWGVVGYLAQSASSVGMAIRDVVDNMRLVHERCAFTLEDGPEHTRIIDNGLTTAGATPTETESALATLLVLLRRWSGDAFRPLRVSFSHVAPAGDSASHMTLFGCPVHFAAEATEMILPKAVVDLPLSGSDPSLHTMLSRRASELTAALPVQSDLLRDIEAIVREQLADGAPTVNHVAKRLGLSSRTLQRRLAAEGISYAAILDRYRRETALRLLDDDRLAIYDVSTLLGFSEPKAFRRAFKRWTGLSPRSYRNARRMSAITL